jgi:hypothetical protein
MNFFNYNDDNENFYSIKHDITFIAMIVIIKEYQ